jgi:heme exporter protein D
MSELLDFGRYTPYIAAAYGASVMVIAALIYQRGSKLAKAREAERRNNAEKN